jgi:hypothetical protein
MGTDLQVIDITDENCGPAMKALTPLQRRFVLAIKEVGSGRWLRAAKIAGYQGDDHVLSVTGSNLGHNPKITAALVEIGGYTMQSIANEATAAVLSVLEAPMQNKGALKLKAALAVLDRIGLGIKTEHTVNINKTETSTEKMILEVRAQLAKNPNLIHELPLPIQKLLADQTKKEAAIDAEFTEVTTDPDANLLGG